MEFNSCRVISAIVTAHLPRVPFYTDTDSLLNSTDTRNALMETNRREPCCLASDPGGNLENQKKIGCYQKELFSIAKFLKDFCNSRRFLLLRYVSFRKCWGFVLCREHLIMAPSPSQVINVEYNPTGFTSLFPGGSMSSLKGIT